MSEIKWWKPSWEWRKEVEALTQQLAEMTLRRAETLAMCDQLTQERDAYELKYDLIRNDQDYQQCCELRRLAYERLADMTAERDEAVRIATELMEPSPVTKADVKQAQGMAIFLNQKLAKLTQERDEAVRIATGLIDWAPITDADVKWAEAKLAAQKHQGGLP